MGVRRGPTHWISAVSASTSAAGGSFLRDSRSPPLRPTVAASSLKIFVDACRWSRASLSRSFSFVASGASFFFRGESGESASIELSIAACTVRV